MREYKEYIVPFTNDVDMERFESLHGTNGELVRCGECRYLGKDGCCAYKSRYELVSLDDYCSKGVKDDN